MRFKKITKSRSECSSRLEIQQILWYNRAMRYKVPQNVQREDQILWFLTLRQVIMLIVGFGFSYLVWSTFRKVYDLNELETILLWLPAGICAALAFVRIKGVSLAKFILLLIEQSLFRPPRRRWQQNAGTPFVSMTTTITLKTNKKIEAAPHEKLTPEKLKQLASVLDTNGATAHPVGAQK